MVGDWSDKGGTRMNNPLPLMPRNMTRHLKGIEYHSIHTSSNPVGGAKQEPL